MKIYRLVSKLLVFGVCLWCLWAGYWLWTTPLTSDGRYFSEISHLGVTPLVVPVLISLMALWSIFKLNMIMLTLATILLLAFWLISGFSIGMVYTPAVILLAFVCGMSWIAIWFNKKNVAE